MELVARVQEYLAYATRRGRARQFASRYFPNCQAHEQEALAVHQLLERLSGKPLRQLVPDIAIEDVVGPPEAASLRGLKIIEVAAVVAALEKQMAAGEEHRGTHDEAPGIVAARVLGQALLGPAANPTKWDPHTLWQRSVRGLVNERVRWRKGCTCVVEEGRPTRGCT